MDTSITTTSITTTSITTTSITTTSIVIDNEVIPINDDDIKNLNTYYVMIYICQ